MNDKQLHELRNLLQELLGYIELSEIAKAKEAAWKLEAYIKTVERGKLEKRIHCQL